MVLPGGWVNHREQTTTGLAELYVRASVLIARHYRSCAGSAGVS